jgi:hypothetical protein
MTPVGNINNMQMSLKSYRKAKIKMLEKEFMIPLKPEEKEHFETLQTEVAIDRYSRTIISSRWN